MSRLFRFLLFHHLRLLLLILSMGLIIYLISDMFEKVDVFFEAETSITMMLQYFLFRIPGIISQILPAIFSVATIIMLCLMAKNRELTALYAGGISIYRIMCYMLFISVFWAIMQLSFSQQVAIIGDKVSEEIWQVQVKKVETLDKPIYNTWFTSGLYIVKLDTLHKSGYGTGFSAFHLNFEGTEIVEIISADTFHVENSEWLLFKGKINYPSQFTKETFSQYIIPFYKNHEVLFLADTQTKPQNLPIKMLSDAIQELRNAGSNVEALQTAWHMKIAYAASLITLTLVAFAILSWQQNIYLCVVLGVFVSFLFYMFTMIGESLGENAIFSPFFAAWFPHFFMLFFALTRIFWVYGIKSFTQIKNK